MPAVEPIPLNIKVQIFYNDQTCETFEHLTSFQIPVSPSVFLEINVDGKQIWIHRDTIKRITLEIENPFKGNPDARFKPA